MSIWSDASATAAVESGDVIRFDHCGRTFAINHKTCPAEAGIGRILIEI